MQPDDFRHCTTMLVRFGDNDMMGHVNNAKYATYIEEARIHYARDVLGWDNHPKSLGMILAKIVIDYLLPLYAGQTIKVYTRCTRMGSKSFDLEYMIVDDQEQTACTSFTAMVAYDYHQEVSVPIPDEWRSRISDYEKVKPA